MQLISVALLVASVLSSGVTIQWVGNRPDNAGEVERRLHAIAGAPEANLADSVASWLNDLGYLDVSALVRHDTLFISSGKRIRLRSVISESGTLLMNEPFSADIVADAVQTLLQSRQDQGHYYARGQIGRVVRDGNHVDLHVMIQPGPIVSISTVQVSGLTRTSTQLLEKFFAPYIGRPLTQQLIEDAQADFERIDFVQPLDSIRVLPDPGYTTARIGMTARERPQATISGGGGVQGDSPRTVVWQADLGFSNPFGDGRSLRLLSSRPERGSTRLEIRYRQPLFLLGRNWLDLMIATRSFDSAFTEIEPRARFSAALAPRVTGTVGVFYRRTDYESSVPDSRTVGADLLLDRDQRQPLRNPARGTRMQSRVAYAFRRLVSDSAGIPDRTTNDTRTELRLEGWIPIGSAFTALLAADYRGLEGEESGMSQAELFLIGGPGSLRGYRNEQFAVQRAVVVTTELRWRIGLSYVGLFWDGAYLVQSPSSESTFTRNELYRHGYGLAMQIGDRQRLARVSLSWSRELSFGQPRLALEFEQDL